MGLDDFRRSARSRKNSGGSSEAIYKLKQDSEEIQDQLERQHDQYESDADPRSPHPALRFAERLGAARYRCLGGISFYTYSRYDRRKSHFDVQGAVKSRQACILFYSELFDIQISSPKADEVRSNTCDNST